MKTYRNAAWIIIAIAAFLLVLFIPIGPIQIRLDLPAPPKAVKKEPPLCVTMKAPSDYYIGSRKTSLTTVVKDLQSERPGQDLKNERVLVWADESVPYEEFISVLNELQAHEIYKVGLINDESGCDFVSDKNRSTQ